MSLWLLLAPQGYQDPQGRSIQRHLRESSLTSGCGRCFEQVKVTAPLWDVEEEIPELQGQTWNSHDQIECLFLGSLSAGDEEDPEALPTNHPSAWLPGADREGPFPSFLMIKPSSCSECVWSSLGQISMLTVQIRNTQCQLNLVGLYDNTVKIKTMWPDLI